MKTTLSLIIATVIFSSCGSVQRGLVGGTESNLIKTVSIEQGCPMEQIKVLDRTGGMYRTYSVEACGKKYVYKQFGPTFTEASKFNEAEMIKAMRGK
jgi:hypothetical protein